MRALLVLSLLLVWVQPLAAGTLSWLTQERWVTVKHVTDGDTFKTAAGEKVRLLGINTPEVRHDTSPAEPFGDQAKKALKRLVLGRQVRLTFDKEKQDQYGRTLAHVYLRDGTWVNAAMVRQGLAHVYTFVPNIRKAADLIAIEQEAIRAGRNMWSHKRWRVLSPRQLRPSMLGQFRLVRGVVTKVGKRGWSFSLDKLAVTVPKKYRRGFGKKPMLRPGMQVLVRGRLRMSRKNKWFLSVHTPSDVYHFQ